jgi:hypothetical protein
MDPSVREVLQLRNFRPAIVAFASFCGIVIVYHIAGRMLTGSSASLSFSGTQIRASMGMVKGIPVLRHPV